MMFHQFSCYGMITTLLEQITLKKSNLFISALLSATKEEVCCIEDDLRKKIKKSLTLQINAIPFNRNKDEREMCYVNTIYHKHTYFVIIYKCRYELV